MAESTPPESPDHRVIHLLDEGGMAKVYLACVRSALPAAQLVVIKQLRSHLSRDADLRRMFLDEARLAAQLDHENVVRPREIIEHGDALSLVMEYVEGQSYQRARTRLAALLDARSLLSLHLYVLGEVLEALAHVHALADGDGNLQLVHCDVSPPNVLLTYEGGVKVVDFGIAVDRRRAQEAGKFQGKLGYASPEQMAGRDVDARSDLYAVGVMLWEAVAGRRLWQEHAPHEIFAAIEAGRVPRLIDYAPGADPRLMMVCERALSVDPELRPQSATAFAAELASVVAAHGLSISRAAVGQALSRAFAHERAQLLQCIRDQLEADGEEFPQRRSAVP